MWPFVITYGWGLRFDVRPSLWDFLETVQPHQVAPRPLSLRWICPAIFAWARRCTVRTVSRVHRGRAKR